MNIHDVASLLPRKTIEGELTTVDDNGSFTMYALVFGNVDRQGDLIEPNAVTNVDELVKDGWIALNHDQSAMPIAIIDSATQDGKGLMVSGRFHSHPRAQEVRSYIKERLDAGKAVKTSIGYLVPLDGEHYERVDGRQVRHISKLSVYEASFVNLPANPEAEVLVAKSLNGPSTVESEEEMSAAAVLKEVKRVLGLSKKGMYKADGEDVEKLRGMCKSLETHGDALEAHAKAFKLMAGSHKEMVDGMTKCLKNFTAGQQQDVDGDNDGDVADKEEEEVPPDDAENEDNDDDATARKSPRTKDDEEDADTKSWRNRLQRELEIESLSEDLV